MQGEANVIALDSLEGGTGQIVSFCREDNALHYDKCQVSMESHHLPSDAPKCSHSLAAEALARHRKVQV